MSSLFTLKCKLLHNCIGKMHPTDQHDEMDVDWYISQSKQVCGAPVMSSVANNLQTFTRKHRTTMTWPTQSR